MKRIVVRETQKDYFIIYLMHGETKINAYMANGLDEKKDKINELLLSEFSEEMEHDEISGDLVEEHSLVELNCEEVLYINEKENNYPLIIVFYLDSEIMGNKDIMVPFSESINDILAEKNANAIALFLPTKGEERVECINPTVVSEADMSKVNKMIEDIKRNFSIEDINIDEEE